MDFYTFVIRESLGYFVALCLENGVVGQGKTKQEAVNKLQEAIDSVQEIKNETISLSLTPISIKELHEFLTVESHKESSEIYELRKVYA